ncbi:hypothetical protein PRZ48_013754 [Zasmidium cellare]|uniref:Nitrate reductase n=1 Tax=Zasmidium cellare TaxID=395010 RepID=A0ABR0E1X8_ZASCE|nr:hypothetical protein PRZ48_013754 [Zasmidium cellare]
MSATQTVLWARVLDRLEGPNPPSLIVVDPRMSDTAKRATVHLAPRIGTNMALLNGIQHLLFREGWIDNAFVSEHCVSRNELEQKVSEYTPEKVEAITNVSASLLYEAAKLIGTSPSLLSTCLQGVYQSNQATASACQVNNINLLRGCIGKPGSGIFQMNGQPTAQNNREAGCDGEFPGFRNAQNPRHMQELADLWNIDYSKVPHWGLPTHVENILNYIEAGSIEMLWISGTNPLVSLPHLHKVRKLLAKPDLFVVAQDIFPTETTAIADVVFPAAQWSEKTGCFTNVDRTVHLAHQAVDPPGEAKADFDIFVEFARRMDFRDKDGHPLMPWQKPEDAFDAWKKLSKGRPCDYTGLSYEMLTGGSGIQWPCNEHHPTGKERLFEDGVFFTDIEYCESFGHDLETGAPISKAEYKQLQPDGRAILKACHYTPDPEAPDAEYPLQLSTGRNVYHFHTRTKTGRSKPLQDACPEPLVRMNEMDAAELGISDGEQVIVKSRRGAIQVKAGIGKISRGQTFIPFHFGYFDSEDERARAANELTLERWDSVSKQPRFKSGAVRIERCPDAQLANSAVVVKSQQPSYEQQVAKNKPNAADVGNKAAHLAHWLGTTFQALNVLQDTFSGLLPCLITDHEVQSGVEVLQKITTNALNRLRPFCERYHTKSKYGHDVSKVLREGLFPPRDTQHSSYETLVVLTGLQTYISNIEAHLSALVPVSQALWAADFVAAVQGASEDVARMQKWVKQQLSVRAAQTLIVPDLNVLGEDVRWTQQ